MQNLAKTADAIACELMINSRGEVCLLVNQRLPNEPQWAEFDAVKDELYLVYPSGNVFRVDFRIDQTLTSYLKTARKILVISLNNNKPTEGYDINLITINS